LSQDKRTELSVRAEKAILVGVLLPESSADPRDPLGELASLTKTAGAQVVAQVIQRRERIDPSTYIGAGKAEEVKKLASKHQADVVIFDNDMSPNQLRDLEQIIDRKILDRSELILDIFATRARTHEAQLQVALAQLEYTYPRLRHMWSHLERISGGASASPT
jgi:GTP-binding protein HflX